jgi:hypothetical protein
MKNLIYIFPSISPKLLEKRIEYFGTLIHALFVSSIFVHQLLLFLQNSRKNRKSQKIPFQETQRQLKTLIENRAQLRERKVLFNQYWRFLNDYTKVPVVAERLFFIYSSDRTAYSAEGK